MLSNVYLSKLNLSQAIFECTLLDSQKPAQISLFLNLALASNTSHEVFETTSLPEALSSIDDYDYNSALIYFLFVLIWYAGSVIALIYSSTEKSRLHYFDDDDNPYVSATNNFLKNKNGDNIRQEALERLRNPLFRKKMWDIYMNNPNTYKMKKEELKKIEQIDKKLKDLNYNTIRDQSSTHKPIYPIQRPHSDQPHSNLFLLKDLDKLDNFNTIHASGGDASKTNWWDSQWETVPYETQSMRSVKNLVPSSIQEPGLKFELNIQSASSSQSISRFKVEKVPSDIV